VANILNGFVDSVGWYHFYRALAGFGLAGELGAGVTLVAEILPTAIRGYGTTIIASVGVLGAVVAGLTGEVLNWRHSYIVGGLLGLVLLFVRVSVSESRMFEETHAMDVERGSFKLITRSRDRLFRYSLCILLGVPTWYVIGILVANVQPITQALGATGVPKQTYCLIWAYLGIMTGDIVGGLVSQRMQSRKKPMYAFLLLGVLSPLYFLMAQGLSVEAIYLCYLVMGFAAGYWILMLTMATEQFGTNIRSTVTVSIPNFIRASVVPMNLAFLQLQQTHDIVWSALSVGIVTSGIALVSLMLLKETFHRDLDFVER
jgi:MFS transporter, putative metabolite:H+ symporter